MRGKYRYVNQNYFDFDTSPTSPNQTYSLGAFFGGYNPKGDTGIEFRSPHRELVEIIKTESESTNRILAEKNDASFYLIIRQVPYLRSRLDALGLTKNKLDRMFPVYVPDDLMPHFIRGFLDSKANIHVEDDSLRVAVSLNHEFIDRMNNVLQRLAGVKSNGPPQERINYGQLDSNSICRFLYLGLDNNSRYVESNRSTLINFSRERKVPPSKLEFIKRMQRAKSLLVRGKKNEEVAELLGYSHLPGFYQAFRNETGMTPGQFKVQCEDKSPKIVGMIIDRIEARNITDTGQRSFDGPERMPK